jgi:hypothetical protein
MTYSTMILKIVKLHEKKWNFQQHVNTWAINELGIKNSAIYFDKEELQEVKMWRLNNLQIYLATMKNRE